RVLRRLPPGAPHRGRRADPTHGRQRSVVPRGHSQACSVMKNSPYDSTGHGYVRSCIRLLTERRASELEGAGWGEGGRGPIQLSDTHHPTQPTISRIFLV